MTSCYTVTLVILLFAVFAANVKGHLNTQRNSYQMIVPECNSPQYTEDGSTDSQIQTALEKPPTSFQAEANAPKVMGHTIHIFKTILRPQTFRQMVIVPYLQRYVRTFQAPVLETVHIQREIPF